MILSMTGYGKAELTQEDKTYMVEIKTLNSKFVDLKMKFPPSFKEKELQLRKHILKSAQRGKLDAVIEITSVTGYETYSLNIPLFKKYHDALEEIQKDIPDLNGDMLTAIMRIPGVVSPASTPVSEEEWGFLITVVDKALANLEKFRMDEGVSIESDFRKRIKSIRDLLTKIDPAEKKRIKVIRQRLRSNLEEYMAGENIDENRFEQEIIFYLEKIDITEEKIRLGQHCLYFLEQLNTVGDQNGRKLNFITQEIGREINTLGAKANSSDIQKIVIMMKDELEKIKEQLANIV